MRDGSKGGPRRGGVGKGGSGNDSNLAIWGGFLCNYNRLA